MLNYRWENLTKALEWPPGDALPGELPKHLKLLIKETMW
jgi:hypothetical protein